MEIVKTIDMGFFLSAVIFTEALRLKNWAVGGYFPSVHVPSGGEEVLRRLSSWHAWVAGSASVANQTQRSTFVYMALGEVESLSSFLLSLFLLSLSLLFLLSSSLFWFSASLLSLLISSLLFFSLFSPFLLVFSLLFSLLSYLSLLFLSLISSPLHLFLPPYACTMKSIYVYPFDPRCIEILVAV